MVIVREPHDVDDAVDQMQEWIGRPVTSASQYYTLYYLVEIEDVDELGFKLMQTASALRDSFYNYSVFATASEAANVYEHFSWEGYTLSKIITRSPRGQPRVRSRKYDDVEREIEERADARDHFQTALRDVADGWEHDILFEIMMRERNLNSAPTRIPKELRYARHLEEGFNAFTDSESWLNAMQALFGYDWRGEHGPHISGDGFGWNPSFGGEAWAKVCETAKLKDEMGKQAYVDLMWSVEHNNGNFIDKIGMHTQDEIVAINDAKRRLEKEEDVTIGMSDNPTASHIRDTMLPLLLDAVKESYLRFAFWVAESTIDDVNLSRYKHHIPNTYIGEEPIPVVEAQ